jgi:hypothetical protein
MERQAKTRVGVVWTVERVRACKWSGEGGRVLAIESLGIVLARCGTFEAAQKWLNLWRLTAPTGQRASVYARRGILPPTYTPNEKR